MALAPTSLLLLNSRASELVIGTRISIFRVRLCLSLNSTSFSDITLKTLMPWWSSGEGHCFAATVTQVQILVRAIILLYWSTLVNCSISSSVIGCGPYETPLLLNFASASEGIHVFSAKTEHVTLYFQHLLGSTRSHYVVDSAIYVIRWVHNLAGIPSATDSAIILAVSRAKKETERNKFN